MPQSSLRRLANRLGEPVDVASIAFFRMAFGAIVAWEVFRYFAGGWIGTFYVRPDYHFTFNGFSWVRPWPGELTYLHFAVVGMLALFVMVGRYYRIAATFVFIGFTQWFLWEKAKYLNHFYLVSLVAFLMIFVPAHRAFSFDSIRRPELKSETVPAWALWLLRFQIGVPYFFGGIAKLNTDWLQGAPMNMWLPERSDFPLIGRYFDEMWMIYAFSYGGLLLDLCVVPLLLWKRTRLVAFLLALSFHLTNFKLFNIGIFPWFMIAGSTLFFEPDWPRRFMRRLKRAASEPAALPAEPQSGAAPVGRLTLGLLGFWVAFQVLVPLRHFLYPGNVNWTEEGHRFSWHMKLRDKEARTRIYVTDPATGLTEQVNLRDYLSSRQRRKMANRPDMILEFVHFLADRERILGRDVEIRVEAAVSLNGRPRQAMIDSGVDLAAVEHSWGPAEWILPLTTPLRATREERMNILRDRLPLPQPTGTDGVGE